MNDNVNHPAHYTDGNIEVIDFIEDKKLGYHLGNAVKYIARAGKKDPNKYVEDLQKAVWYLQREIDRRLDNLHLCKRAPDTNPMEEVSSEEAFFRDIYKNQETSVL